MELPDIVNQAAALAAGYCAAVVNGVAGKVKDTAVERLYSLIESRLSGTASGQAVLRTVRARPEAEPSRAALTAALEKAAAADAAFAAELGRAVSIIQGGATLGGNQVNVQFGEAGRVKNSNFVGGNQDNSRRTIRIGTSGLAFAIVAAAIMLGVTGFAGYKIGEGDSESRASPQPGPTGTRTSTASGNGWREHRVLPDNPYESVYQVYRGVHSREDVHSCGQFTDSAARRWATNMGHPSCPAAISELSGKVTNKSDYTRSLDGLVRPLPNAESQSPFMRISSCQLDIRGGPSLGTFVLVLVDNNQWLIVDHEKDPDPCP